MDRDWTRLINGPSSSIHSSNMFNKRAQRALSRVALSGKETMDSVVVGRHRQLVTTTFLGSGLRDRLATSTNNNNSRSSNSNNNKGAMQCSPTPLMNGLTRCWEHTTTPRTPKATRGKKDDVHAWSIKGRRPEMEDGHCIVRDDDSGKVVLAAVFDGHGGAQVANFLQAEFPNYFLRAANVTSPSQLLRDHQLHCNDNDSDRSACVRILQSCLHQLDEAVLQQKEWNEAGSTAIVAWLHRSSLMMERRRPPTTFLIVANVGDSRALLGRIVSVATADDPEEQQHGKQREEVCVQAVEMTRDHVPGDPDEKHRIEQVSGGKVRYSWWDSPRIAGLSLSRSIGNANRRPFVSSEPEFAVLELGKDGLITASGKIDDNNNNNSDEPEKNGGSRPATLILHEFVVLACDGVFEALDSRRVVELVAAHWKRGTPKSEIPKELVKAALTLGSHDNLTVVILWADDDDRGRSSSYAHE